MPPVGSAVNFPLGHWAQLNEPAEPEYIPAVHCAHAVEIDSPVLAEAVPATHDVQPVAAVATAAKISDTVPALAYLPAAHDSQLVAPGGDPLMSAVNFPAGHSSHVEESAAASKAE